jgi:hypothetical protein
MTLPLLALAAAQDSNVSRSPRLESTDPHVVHEAGGAWAVWEETRTIDSYSCSYHLTVP